MPEDQVITSDEVKRHNTRQSVWIVIRGEVFDVTAFVNEHPGGEDPLLDAAGMDATIAFDDVGHSQDAQKMLKKYKVGILAPGHGCSPTTSTKFNVEPMQVMPSFVDEKPWRTFDGTRSPRSATASNRSDYRPPRDPRVEPRIKAVVVPRQRRGGVCRPPTPPPDSGSSRLKWALLALGIAIILGIAYKKYSG